MKRSVKFSGPELVKVVRGTGADYDATTHTNWSRTDRAIVPQAGAEGYSLAQVAFVALVAILAGRVPQLTQVKRLAKTLAPRLMELLESGPDGDAVAAAPVAAVVMRFGVPQVEMVPADMTVRQLALRPGNAMVIDLGQLAMELDARISDVVAERGV